MPGNMSHDEKDPLFVMNCMTDRPQDWYLHSTEDLEDGQSTTSSTESNPSHLGSRKDHEFIPTRMKTISASKPAADPSQFTRVNSNPLLISAQKQLMKVEEVKKKKEVIKKSGGDDQPDWQDNLCSWKDRRRKQSEEALQRVAEVKGVKIESQDGDDVYRQRKVSIGKKLSNLLYTPEDDWSDLGLERTNNNTGNGGIDDSSYEEVPSDGYTPSAGYPPSANSDTAPRMPRRSLPATIREAITPEPMGYQDHSKSPKTPEPPMTGSSGALNYTEPDFGVDFVRSASRTPGGYGEGIPVLNRKTSAPVMPYGRDPSEEKEAPSVRRKSSELSMSMKSRLEAFNGKQEAEEAAANAKRIVEPDNTFREKLHAFRKISEPQPEDPVPKGPKPPLSYKTLIGNNFSQTNSAPGTTTDHPMMIAEHDNLDTDHDDNEDIEGLDLDDVDQLLDDALEESYRSVLEDENGGKMIQDHSDHEDTPNILPVVHRQSVGKAPPSEKPPAPPTEKPPPPPIAEVTKNQRNLQKSSGDDIDKQEQEIIASLELEEREHKKYMERHDMRNLSPSSSASSDNAGGSSSSRLGLAQPFGKKSASPTFGSVSPALSSDSPRGPPPHPGSTPNMTSGSAPAKKKSSPPGGQSVVAEPTMPTTDKSPPGQQPPPTGSSSTSYNQQHWLIQEAEKRRIAEQQMRLYQQQHQQQPSPVYENSNYLGGMPHVPPPSQYTNHQRPPPGPPLQGPPPPTNGITPPRHHQVQPVHEQPSPNENMYANLGQHPQLPPNFQRDIPPGPPPPSSNMRGLPGPQVPPRNPPSGDGSAAATGGSSDRLLSVSGKKKCSHCKEELGRGAAMIIESLRLFYHLRCFRCVVCHVQLGNGSTGTDVRVRNNKLHCQNCYSNDEGLKFSKV